MPTGIMSHSLGIILTPYVIENFITVTHLYSVQLVSIREAQRHESGMKVTLEIFSGSKFGEY